MNLGYIDPGTGSMLLSTILGGVAAAGVFLKMYWNRVLTFLRIRKPEAAEPERDAGPAIERTSFERAGEPVGKR